MRWEYVTPVQLVLVTYEFTASTVDPSSVRTGPPESPKHVPPLPCAGLAVTRTNSSLWTNDPETSRASAWNRLSSPVQTGESPRSCSWTP